MVSGCNLSCRRAGVSAFAKDQRESVRLFARAPDELRRQVLSLPQVDVGGEHRGFLQGVNTGGGDLQLQTLKGP